jgi:hypothetical protein
MLVLMSKSWLRGNSILAMLQKAFFWLLVAVFGFIFVMFTWQSFFHQ